MEGDKSDTPIETPLPASSTVTAQVEQQPISDTPIETSLPASSTVTAQVEQQPISDNSEEMSHPVEPTVVTDSEDENKVAAEKLPETPYLPASDNEIAEDLPKTPPLLPATNLSEIQLDAPETEPSATTSSIGRQGTSSETSPLSQINVVTDIVKARGGSSDGPDSETTSSGHEDRKVRRRRIGISEDLRNFDGLTRRQLQNLAVLALTDFFGALMLTNQNPWFPIQAKEHGISIGLSGTVFAAFELACFLFFPLFQGKLHRCCVSPQTLFHLGIFTTSAATVLFSFLGYVSDWSLFFGFAIVLRFLEGIGQAALISASFAIIALEFPSALSSAFVSLQTFFGLGLVIGPPLGGALWDAYPSPLRFTLTYGVLGAVSLLVAILGLLFLPQSQGDHLNELERNGYTSGFRVVGLLKVDSVPLMGFTIFSTAVSFGFMYVTLSPILFEFGIHPVLLGGIFLLNGGIAALFAPAFSCLITATHRSKLLTIFGSVLIFFGFCLIGPASFIPLERTAWLISIGLAVQGLGIAALCASTFRFILYQAVKCGYADNVKTYWLVCSLWTMLFCSGLLVGTISSGFLVDGFGFANASWLVLDLQILVVLFTLVSVLGAGIKKYQTSPKSQRSSYTALDTESEPLLGTASRRSKFSGFHRRSEPRKRVISDPSSEPKHSPMKTYGGIDDNDSNEPLAEP